MCPRISPVEGFFKSRWGWALPQRPWFLPLRPGWGVGSLWSLEGMPQATDAPALPWEEQLQTIWLKIFKMPKSRRVGKRHLKGHRCLEKRLILPSAHGFMSNEQSNML